MRQLARFSISVRAQDFVLHIEDDAGEILEFAASPEQLDMVIDVIDELVSDNDEDASEVDDDAPLYQKPLG